MDFGRLERASVRKAWPHEARDFTPWLAENLDRLSTELGINDLELEGTEVTVGPYRADIVARIPEDDSRVLIESQLEHANLQHLGQVLAYLAGLEARIVIWVATGFDESHLSAIRWLNDHTTDPFAFLAVRVSVVRIGDSPLAPVFDVIERPNEWDRTVGEITRSGSLSPVGQFRRDFWAHFAKVLPGAPGPRSGYAGSNVYHPVEQAHLRICQYLAQGEVGVYLTGMTGRGDADVKTRIAQYTNDLREEMGDATRVSRSVTILSIDSNDRNNWDKMAQWLEDRRTIYQRVLLRASASTGPDLQPNTDRYTPPTAKER